MNNINDNNYFHRNSGNSNGLPRIGTEENNYLLFNAISLIGDNDNEYHQKEFIYVDLTNNYMTLAVRLSVVRIIIPLDGTPSYVVNNYDFTADIDYDVDGPSGLQHKFIEILIKMRNIDKKTYNCVKEERRHFIYCYNFNILLNKIQINK